jgi:hypothetical protein
VLAAAEAIDRASLAAQRRITLPLVRDVLGLHPAAPAEETAAPPRPAADID